MKLNQWTVGLAAAGVVSLGSVMQAEEASHQVLTALSSTTLSGYVDTSAIWKFGSGNAPLPGRSFDGPAKQDGFNLNVVKLTVEKPLDEGEWSAGYKVDLLFGPDATGYNASINSAATSDFGIKQAYVAVRAPVGNGIDFKMGTFDTIIGYEVFEAGSNPNYSRSYGWGLEPTQHTGLLASYRVNDVLSLNAGVANTVNPGINDRAVDGQTFGASESEKTYMASMVLTAPESLGFLHRATLYAGVVDGFNAAVNPGLTRRDSTSIYVGTTIPTPLEGLTLGAAYDYVGYSAQKALTSSAYASAASVYLSYQVTEKLKINNRVEYAWSTDGLWYTRGEGGDSDARNELLGVTSTLDYSLWANVISRLEFRWDSAMTGGMDPVSKPFGIADKNAISLALNLIYKF